MRVIAGECKGRQLKTLAGQITRPTTDKVKEAIFNRVGPFFEGGTGLDLYSGSGSLGIEGLSRGLDKVVFVDRHPAAIEVIKANINLCRLESRAEIYKNSVSRALKVLHEKVMKFDIIFMDPPYAIRTLQKELEQIASFQLLKIGGLLVVEHAEDNPLDDLIENKLSRLRSDTYNGRTVISLYEYI